MRLQTQYTHRDRRVARAAKIALTSEQDDGRMQASITRVKPPLAMTEGTRHHPRQASGAHKRDDVELLTPARSPVPPRAPRRRIFLANTRRCGHRANTQPMPACKPDLSTQLTDLHRVGPSKTHFMSRPRRCSIDSRHHGMAADYARHGRSCNRDDCRAKFAHCAQTLRVAHR